MTNDTTTLQGSLDEMKDQLITQLDNKGVPTTYSSTTGLLGLIAKIDDIEQGRSGCPRLVIGSFTTGSTGGGTGTVTINYNGNGYPIALLIYPQGGISNQDNTSWATDIARYDVGMVLMVKAFTTTTPSYATSGSANYGAIRYVYKSSTSNATSYSCGGSQTANTYTSSSTNASTSSTMIRFKGNNKTLSYYIGNRTSSTYGLARDTTFDYIIVYNE